LWNIFFVYSGKMSSNNSPPRVRQRIEKSVANRRLRMEKRQVLSERNILRADLRDAVLLPIGQMLLENQWEYLYNCACPIFPRLVRDFYGHMVITQDDDRGLVMQTMVRGHTFQIDPQLISSMIGVPVLPVPGVPFPPGVKAPNIDFLHDFFGRRPQREDKSHSQINIGAFAPMHRFLAKVVVTNLWPQARRSELTLKKATLLYAIVMRTPFCLCKHILHTMLEVRDETNTSLSFGCLITQICRQVVIDISDSKPRSRILDPLAIQTLMKSNAQLRHKAQGDVLHPPLVPVALSAAAPSSQAVPLSFDIEAAFTQLMSSMGAAFGLPTVSKSFSVEDIRTSRQHCPDVDLLWEELHYSGKAVTEDRPDEANFYPNAPQLESEFV